MADTPLPPADDDTTPDRHAATTAVSTAQPDTYKWPRRMIMLGALALGLAFCIYAIQRAPGPGTAGLDASDPAIVRQVPDPGGHILRQTSVGAQLHRGYDGRLTINGVDISEDEMDGAAPVGSPAYDPRYGVRPNNKEHVFFTPGPGKAVSRYPTGEVHLSLRFWPIDQGQSAAKTVSWAFFVN